MDTGVGLGVSTIPSICGMLLKDWAPYGKDVLIVGKHPLLENSMILCRLGGNVMILYSEKAADEFTDKVIAKTALTVGAIVCVSYLASALVISVTAAESSLMLTYAGYGLTSSLSQTEGMATVFGTSYVINAGYDLLKDTTGFENYVSGEAYNPHTKPENVTPPGTTVSNTTISANNRLPNSNVGATQIQVNQNNTKIRVTPNTTTASSTSITSTYGTQCNNNLTSNSATGVKTTFSGVLKNLGINLAIDLL